MNRFLSISRGVVTVAVILGAAAPLVVTPWLSFPFGTGKTLFLELVALSAFPFWTALLALDPGSRPRHHPLVLALAAQTVVLVLAGIFGVDPAQSFWGRDERMLGGITLLTLLLFFGLTLTVFRNDRVRLRILLIVVAVGSVNIIWGILERFFPAFWSDFRGGSIRVVGLIGNPIFYAGYVIGIVFLALSLISQIQTRLMRAFLAVVAVAGTFAVLFSGTRGAELGLFAGAAAWLALISVRASTRAVRRGALAALIAGATLTVVLTMTVSGAEYNPVLEPFARLRSAFTTTDSTATQRLVLWKAAWKGIWARPLLGWGPENFDYLFDQHFDPLFLKFTLRETFADRPHNAFIEAATDAGLLGLLAFLAVQAAFLHSVFRLRRSGGSLWTCSALIGFLAASDIHLLFAFETVPSLVTEFLVFAWLAARTAGAETPAGKRCPRRTALALASSAGIISVALLIFGVALPASAFGSIHLANITDPQARTDEWLGHLRRATSSVQPYRDAARYRAGNAIFAAVGDGRVPEDRASEALSLGIGLLREEVRGRSGDYAGRFTLGNLLLLAGIRGDAPRFAEAEAEFLRAAELSPRRQSTYIQLGNLKAVSGDAAASLPYYQKAVDLDPAIGEPHWHYARGLLKAGERELAADEFQRARELGYGPKIKNEILEAASLLYGQGRIGETIGLYEYAVEVFPDDAELYARLAAGYAAIGNAEAARTAVKKAVLLDPSFAAEAKVFLNLLGEGALFTAPPGE